MTGISAETGTMVDWPAFSAARAELGASFARILGYFREDGVKSVDAIESAMRTRNAAAMVIPAHTLKGEARQFGAVRLASMAEMIEDIARDCVESRDCPDQALAQIAQLRPLFQETLELLEQASSPLAERRSHAGFGRRAIVTPGPLSSARG